VPATAAPFCRCPFPHSGHTAGPGHSGALRSPGAVPTMPAASQRVARVALLAAALQSAWAAGHLEPKGVRYVSTPADFIAPLASATDISLELRITTPVLAAIGSRACRCAPILPHSYPSYSGVAHACCPMLAASAAAGGRDAVAQRTLHLHHGCCGGLRAPPLSACSIGSATVYVTRVERTEHSVFPRARPVLTATNASGFRVRHLVLLPDTRSGRAPASNDEAMGTKYELQVGKQRAARGPARSPGAPASSSSTRRPIPFDVHPPSR
jgi:hypothetical protein